MTQRKWRRIGVAPCVTSDGNRDVIEVLSDGWMIRLLCQENQLTMCPQGGRDMLIVLADAIAASYPPPDNRLTNPPRS